ncbi:TPM domain-containing protein [uncultured Rhodoblastus sp.]|uniref:TPM domain-containing protein n=1 Tax=uncultured Rhodoblastus sp. TaxID=543037 RepID=UPI0025FF35ED|nr:TPM domain-containing protein [uncultured Rhodoblastus sp.]
MREALDEAAIVAAVQAAERRTSGQIVCVFARRTCELGFPATLYAATLALIAPWPLLAFTQLSAQRIFAVQAALFIVALLLLNWTWLGLALTPRGLQRRQAFRVAAEQFFTLGMTRTRHRTGVLIFVSMAEHYARIIADDGLTGKIAEAEWRAAIDEMVDWLRVGRVNEAFILAVNRTGELLARAAPPDGGGNDLPDRLVRID